MMNIPKLSRDIEEARSNVIKNDNRKPVNEIKDEIIIIKKDIDEIKLLLKELKDVIKPDPIDELLKASYEEYEPIKKGWLW